MNYLGLDVKIIKKADLFELDGLFFTQAAFIWPNSASDLRQYIGNDGLIVFSELEKSLSGSGAYLIFTAVGGIAIDSGWDYVNVEYTNSIVNWEFWINDNLISLSFDLTEYHSEIIGLKDRIKNLPQGVVLEPSQIIFPDD